MYLIDINLRGDVLIHLNKLIKQRGENCIDLALELWNSFNTVYILLQEVTAAYRRFSTSTLTMEESTRVRNALAVLQQTYHIIFTHFSKFLNEKPLEFVRLGSLDLIGALAKFDDQYGPEILNFFLDTQGACTAWIMVIN
ncbi:cell differentiation protein rcd1-like [Lycium ferocissimum]|uniref:cell differentiation protein rcd1-like n=1 Tax=Lycium ferocissimum TaxID=112874 RepID=UPI002815AE5E|nr:cell differentiation protein rcd1-like [Lycium ferocissimum]